MSYKGHDLELRPARADPPREETSGPAAAKSQSAQASREPIAVDQVVLDCCNAAYDVARVHGAREVRLEHLLHTLTRVGPATAVLEELGIRVDQLRRQTAVAIAAEAPGATAHADSAPVASAPFEEVLRRAAGEAGRRQAAATLHDILRALLESPAATLLLQSAGDPQRLTRWREETSRPSLSTVAAPAPDRAAGMAPAVADAVLKRLGALEAAFQSLQANVAADRTAMADILRELRAELAALRTSRPSPPDAPPRAAEDSAIEARLGELGRAVTALADRSAALDRFVAANPWEEMHKRVEAAEGRVGGDNLAAAGTFLGAVAERLAQTEASVQQLREDTDRHGTAAKERQQALEASVRAQVEKAEEARKGHDRALSDIYEALLKLGTNQHALGDNFTTWRSETSGDLAIISTRLEQLDHAALDMLSQLSVDLHSRRRENGVEGTRLGENLKRWLHGTSTILATSWRKEAPAYEPAPPAPPPPTPEAVLSREPEPTPAKKPSPPAEDAKPSQPAEAAKPS